MPLFGEFFYLIDCQEGIVDKWVVAVSLMDVDDAYSCVDVRLCRCGFGAIVIIAVRELAFHIQWFYRGDNHGKVEGNGLVGFQCTCSAICHGFHSISLFPYREAALTAVKPAFRIGRTIQIQQRTAVGAASEFTVDTCMFVSDPETVEWP